MCFYFSRVICKSSFFQLIFVLRSRCFDCPQPQRMKPIFPDDLCKLPAHQGRGMGKMANSQHETPPQPCVDVLVRFFSLILALGLHPAFYFRSSGGLRHAASRRPRRFSHGTLAPILTKGSFLASRSAYRLAMSKKNHFPHIHFLLSGHHDNVFLPDQSSEWVFLEVPFRLNRTEQGKRRAFIGVLCFYSGAFSG